jgi:glycosyltransferase involved in cell wall biosynthesis
MLNILVVHIRFAEYDRCAGDLRLSNLLRILSGRNKVALHILYKPPEFIAASEHRKYLNAMQQLGIEVKRGSLRARLREQRYDVVLIEFWYVARHLFNQIRTLQPDARIIVDTEHVYFHANHLRAVALAQDPEAAKLREDKKLELDTYAKADLVITTTDEDKAVLLRENPQLSIATIPTIHGAPMADAPGAARVPNSLVCVANFANNPANVDGIVYFCAEILPLIRQRIPSATLTIVGNKPPAAVQSLASDHVTVTGYVPDVEPHLASSMVSICPLRFGAGLKGKIGEAMMHGVPVVTSSIGTQGMDCRIGEDIMVGDTPHQFARCVVELLEQPALWWKLARNGRALVERDYSFEAVSARINRIVSDLGAIAIKRYRGPRRLALKLRFDVTDLLDRHVLWKFRRST